MRRRTISFDDQLFEAIEKYRKSKTPIPSFTVAVTEILKEGLRL